MGVFIFSQIRSTDTFACFDKYAHRSLEHRVTTRDPVTNLVHPKLLACCYQELCVFTLLVGAFILFRWT